MIEEPEKWEEIEKALEKAAKTAPCIEWKFPVKCGIGMSGQAATRNHGLHVETKTHTGCDGTLSFDDAVRAYEDVDF